MSLLTVTQLEAAINYWRQHHPATGDEARLCPEASALAAAYATMIMAGLREIPLETLSPEAVKAYRTARTV